MIPTDSRGGRKRDGGAGVCRENFRDALGKRSDAVCIGSDGWGESFPWTEGAVSVWVPVLNELHAMPAKTAAQTGAKEKKRVRCGGRIYPGGAGGSSLLGRAVHFRENGSGTGFFSGCPLRCVYCQNYDNAHRGGNGDQRGTIERNLLELQEKGAHATSIW